MTTAPIKPDTETVFKQLDLAIERAELVRALGRLADHIHRLKQQHPRSPEMLPLERAARALEERLQHVKHLCEGT